MFPIKTSKLVCIVQGCRQIFQSNPKCNNLKVSKYMYLLTVIHRISVVFCSSRVTSQCKFYIQYLTLFTMKYERSGFQTQRFSSEVYLASPKISMPFIYMCKKNKVQPSGTKAYPSPAHMSSPTH